MALFKNTTRHPIPIMVNGSRKMINPNRTVDGPESLNCIPGLTKIQDTKKTILFNNTPKPQTPSLPLPEKLKMIIPDKPSLPQFNINVDSSSVTDLSTEINLEIDHLNKFYKLGRNPSVTIAILTKNSLPLIKNCCESIFEQVKYDNVVIMIADTGTTEQSVLSYYTQIAVKCEEKKWRYKQVNLGHYHYSKNYNDAIKHVDTEFVLIQNNDTVALNDYVSEMMQTAIMRKVGSVGCRMFYPDRTRIQHDGQTMFNAPGGMFGGPSHVHLNVNASTLPESFTTFVDGNTAAGVLMSLENYNKVDGFESTYKDIFQDVDLMIKIPNILKKYNYCNRQAKIIHIDNATRLGSGHDPKIQAAMWEDTYLLKKRILNNSWERLVKPKEYEFSIITLVYDFESYKTFCDSIKKQIGSHSVEFIAIPNFNNQINSAYKALNEASDVASGKYLVFCHDDIVVTKDWLLNIKKNILSLESKSVNWGVLGPAGVSLHSSNSFYYLLDSNGTKLSTVDNNILNDQPFYEVSSLDELCLITKKSNNLRFSENHLSGFHFYGVNICLVSQLKNLKNYAINAYCYHKSDGYKNLKSKEQFSRYEKNLTELFTWAKSNGIISWRTTTSICVNGEIKVFLKNDVDKQ